MKAAVNVPVLGPELQPEAEDGADSEGTIVPQPKPEVVQFFSV